MTLNARVAHHLDTVDTITIVTTKKDGTTVPTFVWSVAADGVGYLRSAFGSGSWWYRRSLTGRPAAIDLGVEGEVAEAGTVEPVPVDIEHVPDDAANAELHAALDEALRRKYGYTPENLAPMLTAEARANTVRVVARAV